MSDKFYRCEPGEPPFTLDELIAANPDVWSDGEIQAMRALEFGASMKFGGGAAAEYEIVCLGTENELRLLEVLEANDSRCMDDEDDRLALARELICDAEVRDREREPSFTLKASDPIGPIVLRIWIAEAKALGIHADKLADAERLSKLMTAWQRAHGVKEP